MKQETKTAILALLELAREQVTEGDNPRETLVAILVIINAALAVLWTKKTTNQNVNISKGN